MNELGNKYALAALRERRAEIAGEIESIDRRLRFLRTSLVNLDGTLRLFDPEFDPKAIPPKRSYKRSKTFGGGKLNRMILDALRKAGEPISTAEVTQSVCAELGYGEEAGKTIRRQVRANLAYLVRTRDTVVKEGDGTDARWGLRG